MLHRSLALALFAGLGLLGSAPSDDPPRRDNNFVVHEWGTFTTVAGSNGKMLVGLTHDEEALPRFVYHRNQMEKNFDGVNVKMETPVIYVYSDVEREVSFKVGFPKGVLTQWYPQVRRMEPKVDAKDTATSGGVLDWGTLTVMAPSKGTEKFPATAAGDPWVFARQTKANVLRNCNARFVAGSDPTDHERFLFYRGLGSFELPIAARADGEKSVILENRGKDAISRFVCLRVGKGSIALGAFDSLEGGAKTNIPTELPETSVEAAMDRVAEELAREGLFADEARAMVNTWRKSYFETEGFRILYFVPRRLTDQILPLTIDPAPKTMVRVLVGRLDVLLPSYEEKAKKTIEKAKTIEQAEADLGRFAEPIVRHLRDTTDDAELRARADALLGGRR